MTTLQWFTTAGVLSLIGSQPLRASVSNALQVCVAQLIALPLFEFVLRAQLAQHAEFPECEIYQRAERTLFTILHMKLMLDVYTELDDYGPLVRLYDHYVAERDHMVGATL